MCVVQETHETAESYDRWRRSWQQVGNLWVILLLQIVRLDVEPSIKPFYRTFVCDSVCSISSATGRYHLILGFKEASQERFCMARQRLAAMDSYVLDLTWALFGPCLEIAAGAIGRRARESWRQCLIAGFAACLFRHSNIRLGEIESRCECGKR